ncbi:MAG: cupin domain-containing protein [Pseudohongiellaceae bacterium]
MITTAFGTERFLRHYWQRRPVLLKQALSGFVDPISAEELAGLACESEAEARLVHHARGHWQLQPGPVTESDFLGLPDHDWTLLVQAVDQWVPGVKALLQEVPFLPRWRVDDVMISYATPGGGVGPHFDYYDVFLIQGQGRRRWQTGQACSSGDLLRTESGLKLLKDFQVEQDWILESGDVLYVPPGVAHFVEADEDTVLQITVQGPWRVDPVTPRPATTTTTPASHASH